MQKMQKNDVFTDFVIDIVGSSSEFSKNEVRKTATHSRCV